MSRYTLLILNGAILTGCAVFIYPARTSLLTALLLLLPLLDRSWYIPDLTPQKKQLFFMLAILCLYALVITLHPDLLYKALMILFLVALPEEWFFRAYFMIQLESLLRNKISQTSHACWLSNIATSFLFSLTHIPIQGLFGLSVFFPSLFFGWLYQKRKNLILVVLLHALSNLIFIIYIRKYLNIQ
ncbi:MAG: CPBP family intramembrane metalloprotease [Gammaproteobacteria bacterium]|nr:CPBP family intramembrane metalloprotease [Gammaproteobacteria bacterium]